MAISCDPATIVKAAACFSCISRDMQEPVELYLLAVSAMGSLDPKVLQAAAAAFRAVPKDMREPLRLFLLAKIAGCQ